MASNVASKITAQDLADIQKDLPVKTCLVIIRRGTSDSGLSRWYDVYSVNKSRLCGSELFRHTFVVAGIIGHSYDRKREAIRVNGCGFSGAEEISSELGRALWGDPKAFEYQEI